MSIKQVVFAAGRKLHNVYRSKAIRLSGLFVLLHFVSLAAENVVDCGTINVGCEGKDISFSMPKDWETDVLTPGADVEWISRINILNYKVERNATVYARSGKVELLFHKKVSGAPITYAYRREIYKIEQPGYPVSVDLVKPVIPVLPVGGGEIVYRVSTENGVSWDAYVEKYNEGSGWVTLSVQKGSGNKDVKITVAPNVGGTKARTAQVHIASKTFVIEQDAISGLTPTTRSFELGGGGGAITVSGSGAWKAAASEAWIQLNATSGAVGTPVAYKVTASTNVGQRVGYVYVSGYTHTVTQNGYEATVDPTSVEYERDGGTGTIDIELSGKWAWNARPNVDWLSVTPTHGVGSGSVTYQVAPYYEVATRSGTLTVGDKTVTVFQYGSHMKLSKNTATCNYETHVVPVTVDALAITEWSAKPNASWLSIVDSDNGQNRRGGGSLSIAVAENPSYKARTGTVTIGTETLTIKQEGRTVLDFSISPATATAAVTGGNGLLAVLATPDLPWTVKSEANWLTIMSGFTSGAGNGNVVYVASPNSTLSQRTGKITVTPPSGSGLAVKTLIVTQPAATSAISPSGYEFEVAGESVDVEVTVADIVQWSISESLDWITVSGSTSRVGPGKVTIAASANNTVYPRSGTVTIAGKKFSVSQKARGVRLDYDNIVFKTDGGYESFTVHPDGNVAWTAVASDASWITVFGATSGTGEAEVEYIISPYVGDGTPRTGWIQVGDQKVYITQRSYDLDITPRAATVTGNNGEGEIGVSAGIGDIWNAIVTEPWVTIVTGYDAGTGNGTVRYTYTENNTGKTRTAKVIIAGEVYTLTQAARIMVAITAEAEGCGRVDGAGAYSLGSEVTLTAVADDGYEFLYWTGAKGETMQNPITLTADVAKSVTAHFGPLTPEFTKVECSTEGVKLTWQNLAWATTYKIYRAPTNEFPTKELATLTADGSCTYVDTTGTVGTPYFYWVEAIGVADTTESKDAVSGTKQKPIVISAITYANLHGATHTNPETYQEGTVVAFTPPSGRTGYTFTGWTPAAITADMTGAQTVTAGWRANTYQIAYYANGGSGTMTATDCEYDKEGEIAANGFTRSGYVFKGWATEENGEVVYRSGDKVTNLTSNDSGVVKLYAVWEEIPVVPPVYSSPYAEALDEVKLSKFVADGESDWSVVTRADCVVGSTCVRGGLAEVYDEIGDEASLSVSVKGPGTVSFWWRVSCDADPAEEFTWDSASFLVDGVLVAQIDGITEWRQVSFEITGEEEHQLSWVYSTDGYEPELAGVEDCVWIDGVAWSGESAAEPVVPLVDPVISPANGSTFATDTCTVTITCATPDAVIYYSTNGRTPSISDSSRYTGPFVISKTTTVKVVAVRGEEKSAYISATITKEVLIPYSIAYDANGGDGEMASTACTYGTACLLPACTFIREGYSFTGWATSASGDVAYADGATVSNLTTTAGATVTLYAKWNYLPLADPVIAPDDGTTFDTESCTVTISCASADAVIYYSTNGRTPSTTDANRYTGPFAISKTTTVKAVAVRGEEKSAYVSATLTKVGPKDYVDAEVGKDVTGMDASITVPARWVTEYLVSHYGPGKVEAFREKFGSDLAVALTKPTGKIGPNGEVLKVWDDYVAGTDPTDLNSRFRAKVSVSNGKVYVAWEPNLNDGSVSRIYTGYGRTELGKGDWETPIQPWHKFFKVSVRMPSGADGEKSAVVDEGFVPEEKPLGGVQLWEGGPYWAECNVGATKPEESGYYFWWGDTVGYKRNANDDGWISVKDSTSFQFGPNNCPTHIKENAQLLSAGYIDETGNLVAKYDAATAHLGAPWRMPTDAEFSALINNCDTEWTSRNGVSGRLVKGRGVYASKSIFLPAAGLGCDSSLYDSLYDLGSYGYYWSSTPDSDYSSHAWDLYFVSVYFGRDYDSRYFGQSVRPVRGFAK